MTGYGPLGGIRPELDLLARGEDFLRFWRERHLCSLTTVRPDGTAHVVAVGVTLDAEAALARVITSRHSRKARLVAAASTAGAPAGIPGTPGAPGAAVAVCQIDGRRWSTLEGRAVIRDDPASIREAERRYTERYRSPRANPHRVVIEISLTRVLGSV